MELKAVLSGIAEVKLPRAPRSLGRRRPGAVLASANVDPAVLDELVVDRINVVDVESVDGAVGRMRPLIRARPLKMKFDPVARDPGVLRSVRIVRERERETKAAIELHRGRHVACRQNGDGCFEAWVS